MDFTTERYMQDMAFEASLKADSEKVKKKIEEEIKKKRRRGTKTNPY
jgi:hypothetical protein